MLTTIGGKLFLLAVAITPFARASATSRFIVVAPDTGAVDVAVVLVHREEDERLSR